MEHGKIYYLFGLQGGYLPLEIGESFSEFYPTLPQKKFDGF
jgi:hypothetical protein